MGMWGPWAEVPRGRRVRVRERGGERRREEMLVRMQARFLVRFLTGRGESGKGETIVGFSLHDFHAFVFGDEEVEFFVGVLDGANLVMFVDVVAGYIS